MHILEMEWKTQKKSSIFQIIPFEIIAENSAYCGMNTCHRRSMC